MVVCCEAYPAAPPRVACALSIAQALAWNQRFCVRHLDRFPVLGKPFFGGSMIIMPVITFFVVWVAVIVFAAVLRGLANVLRGK